MTPPRNNHRFLPRYALLFYAERLRSELRCLDIASGLRDVAYVAPHDQVNASAAVLPSKNARAIGTVMLDSDRCTDISNGACGDTEVALQDQCRTQRKAMTFRIEYCTV